MVKLVGNFHCIEVWWETLESERGENTRKNRLLSLTIKNTMTEWVTDNTRYRREDKLSRLNY